MAVGLAVVFAGVYSLVPTQAQQKADGFDGFVIDSRNREAMADDLLRDLELCKTAEEKKLAVVVVLKLTAGAERRRFIRTLDVAIANDVSHQAAKTLRGVEPWTVRDALKGVMQVVLDDHMNEAFKKLPK